jgi:hypothetical protein
LGGGAVVVVVATVVVVGAIVVVVVATVGRFPLASVVAFPPPEHAPATIAVSSGASTAAVSRRLSRDVSATRASKGGNSMN